MPALRRVGVGDADVGLAHPPHGWIATQPTLTVGLGFVAWFLAKPRSTERLEHGAAGVLVDHESPLPTGPERRMWRLRGEVLRLAGAPIPDPPVQLGQPLLPAVALPLQRGRGRAAVEAAACGAGQQGLPRNARQGGPAGRTSAPAHGALPISSHSSASMFSGSRQRPCMPRQGRGSGRRTTRAMCQHQGPQAHQSARASGVVS